MNVVTSRAQFRFFNVKKCEEECQLQLILSNVLICGHLVYAAISWGVISGIRFAAALLEMELETLLKGVIITMR